LCPAGKKITYLKKRSNNTNKTPTLILLEHRELVPYDYERRDAKWLQTKPKKWWRRKIAGNARIMRTILETILSYPLLEYNRTA
jgi:hypothetical protein